MRSVSHDSLTKEKRAMDDESIPCPYCKGEMKLMPAPHQVSSGKRMAKVIVVVMFLAFGAAGIGGILVGLLLGGVLAGLACLVEVWWVHVKNRREKRC